uniref:RING-type domain-containing protein n=1 Tax=Chromera velia CCMP2878 TaxID=1169474 RepID=A0A0G4I8S0_9ALVE|mmetsp:Transcript_20907/g.41689  ORF Transcript_20907/g.41689 Transcript_20907/m.41689 type:complete len:474 (-) Transcript_20907:161-1582(-)|eukprot:Cvel_11938.t1-p1 / transcript=Cvel_11938.t1 / gene=Cvel_11938 / organism=Chromera_velia_CCMP2878 / gene_product=E3 ubiquitin-protein ligase PDZRN3, putative / transcript_product=E3 ubiquitin-protein ligase PDZRN3, putative / location=Cvel_scaffold765:8598-12147(+) / protein_length=473 / sequence_SO=supercontig / SO=protein_coding / is_pseudo=false
MPRLPIAQVANADEAEHLQCAICFEIPEDPRVVTCRSMHMFCNKCIKPWAKQKQQKSCPCCRGTFSEIRDPPLALKNTLQKTKYQCQHKGDGCKFVGTVEEVVEHQKTCPEAPVTCEVPNCDKTLKRKAMESHKSNKTQKQRHERLNKEEIDRLKAEPGKDSLLTVIRFPNFESRMGTLRKGSRLQSCDVVFQGERFCIELIPKGRERKEASLWMYNTGGLSGKLSVTVAVGVVGGSTEVTQNHVWERKPEDIVWDARGWQSFCTTEELISAARTTEDGALELRLRLSGPSKPVLDVTEEAMREVGEDSLGVKVTFSKFAARALDCPRRMPFESDAFLFRDCKFQLRLYPSGEKKSKEGHCGVYLVKLDAYDDTLFWSVPRHGYRRWHRVNFSEQNNTGFPNLFRKDELIASALQKEGDLELILELRASRKSWVKVGDGHDGDSEEEDEDEDEDDLDDNEDEDEDEEDEEDED